ncbi:MAG: FkbM family methyltransferase [Bacteroidia bacterium]|nr:FkbM family methyltransferase [Bacteroidia bacterium]
MNFLNTAVYRIIVPKFFRKKIVARVLRSNILAYYSSLKEPLTEEISKVCDYVKNCGIAMIPYYFQDEYIEDTIEVHYDTETGLRYVVYKGKRLYFKRRWSKKRIRLSFNELRREQDNRSPHCYETDGFVVEKSDVLVDIGAAEGIFALSNIEQAGRIVLFESGKEWIEPLKATFAPWKEKVTIVNKFAGNVTNGKCVTLDDYFLPGEKLSFLKIDVEGAESLLLSGCRRILSEVRPLKVAICTYHKDEDERELNETLKQNGFETSPSDGFLIIYTDRKLKAPYLRRGLIRAIKN